MFWINSYILFVFLSNFEERIIVSRYILVQVQGYPEITASLPLLGTPPNVSNGIDYQSGK